VAPCVEYTVAITFFGKPEPDDPRTLAEQAAEQVEALGSFLEDVGAVLDVVRVKTSADVASGGLDGTDRACLTGGCDMKK
jgi:hypothetical protein